MSIEGGKFLVLLASYKGQSYLLEQVSSILDQVNVNVSLHISDDFSAQSTRSFLEKSGLSQSVIKVFDGPHSGVNSNFLSLVYGATYEFEFYAFSDQDDVWHRNKLVEAQKQLIHFDRARAVLYMGQTMVCDETLEPLFLSKNCPREPSFKNALLEVIAGANTMVFNQQTLKVLQKVSRPVHHDWLAYMAVTACGGEVVFDDVPYVLYRQHLSNVVGANKGFFAKWQRFTKIMNNEFRSWITQNILALEPLVSDMTPENKEVYFGFKRLHNLQGWYYSFYRLYLFHRLGIYRQRRIDQLGFMLAAFLGKI